MFERQRRYPDAYALYKEILKIKPKDIFAKEGLARLKKYVGEERDA